MTQRDPGGRIGPLAVIVRAAVTQPVRHRVDGGFRPLGTQAMVDETYDSAHRMGEGEPPCKGAIEKRRDCATAMLAHDVPPDGAASPAITCAGGDWPPRPRPL